ncbi:hypothetical protein N9X87_00060 [bacterium]|nr:hypothetical protein [bacterium]
MFALVKKSRTQAVDTDLSEADLKTGEVSIDECNLKRLDWLWYQYPQTPSLKHSVPPEPRKAEIPTKILSEALYSQYVRPIAIVSATGIESFFSSKFYNIR